MGKTKAAKLDAVSDSLPGDRPALVVFGRDEGGRPHASTFTAAEAELATRAAALMGMWALPVTNDKHRQVASELPVGRVFSSGKAFTPFTTEGTHARLEAFGEAFQPAAPVASTVPLHSTVPQSWASIEVGSLVLAGDTAAPGFFEAVVIEEPGAGLFLVQWRDWPDVPPFPRRREHLALLTESLATLADQLDAEAEGVKAAGTEA